MPTVRHVRSRLGSSLSRDGWIRTALPSVLAAIAQELDAPGAEPLSPGRVLDCCLTAAGLSRGAILEATPSGLKLLAGSSSLGGKKARDGLPRQGGLLGKVQEAGRPVAVRAGQARSARWRRFLADLGVQAAVLVPMRWGKGRRGIFILGRDDPGSDDGFWLGFAQDLAAHLGHALTLSETIARLRESERALAHFADNLREVLWMSTPAQDRLFYASPAYESVWGLPLKELYRSPRAWLDAIHPEERQRVIEERCRVRKRGECSVEYRIRRPDGSVRWIRDKCRAVKGVSGETTCVVGVAEDITEAKLAKDSVSANESRLQLLLDSTAEGIYGVDLDGKCTLVNRSCLKSLGYSRAEELLGRRMHEAMHHSRADGTPWPAESCLVYDAFRKGRPYHADEETFWRKDGTPLPVEFWSYPIFKDGKAVGSVATFIDITERKRAAQSLAQSEAQLRQAQKMEGIGRLAGGVAHDFNNLLTAILGLSELSAAALPADHPARKDLLEINEISHRAAKLTQQLLAFSRKQIFQPQKINLNELTASLEKMLRRIIGEDVALSVIQGPALWVTKVDPGQIEQVIVNLCVNARDAMPRGGRITIETRNASLGKSEGPGDADPPPGDYVVVSISDNGTGMTDEVKKHLFEPFFTTKPRDKGTGLGLATCFGIAKQSGGGITVDSELGRGSTFQVYLPRAEGGGKAQRPAPAAGGAPRGAESILVVEDEALVRSLTVRILRGQGYEVREAADADEALALVRSDAKRELRLLLTDVIMPRRDGKALAEAVGALRPDMAVLFTSGYADDAIVRHGMLEEGIHFIPKPFTRQALASKVREILDASSRKPGPSSGNMPRRSEEG